MSEYGFAAVALGFGLVVIICLLLNTQLRLHAVQLRILHERIQELEKTLERLVV